jgi:hypothetical protein
MTFWDFMDKNAEGLWLLAIVSLMAAVFMFVVWRASR